MLECLKCLKFFVLSLITEKHLEHIRYQVTWLRVVGQALLCLVTFCDAWALYVAELEMPDLHRALNCLHIDPPLCSLVSGNTTLHYSL
jgi:hypothetical protein